ncbi:MAG TPA: phosphatidate cytidylyltransferase, partial [Steroidobacteraceae bacterium]|nr:phosphatidate cytidylyltransferase [Steroidobacteraceae bacterium]
MMLRQRILTALVLVPLLLIVLFVLPPWLGVVALAAIVLIGSWEWSVFPGFATPAGRAAYVAVVAAAMGLLWALTGEPQQLRTVMFVATFWWLVAFAWMSFAPTNVGRASAWVAGLLVLAPAWVGLARLQSSGGLGPWLVLFLLVLVWAADIGAYFAGRRLGRIKLAPRVSPGKTWEGVIGGLVLAAVVAMVMGFWLGQGVAFTILCLAVVLASVVGDLTESMFKRFAGVKD